MSDNTNSAVVSEAEKAYAKLQAGDSKEAENKSEKRTKREKAAREWVSHFNAIMDILEDKSIDVEPSEAGLVEALVSSWEAKADNRDTNVSNRLAALRG